ncbi:hypothetical protein DICPUDRAFT_28940 [Dictyostelium purpureum]|uniref:Anaphase-promoting complex subunit 4-like WD40 domain-containing protein n=1 Tax=Dictyostelium purpureum TaxID=5786 RepID=F0ZCP5_DICPU|nr:uncharacterized protein DICPUDRAFT_28940 [Dictyostelium purpureum]EGC38305.1 hypothetical protein DICPUDRAFT_28940 [Dictyostelium purpureum]|eukprot:XP_003285166.1 hypothetical protein DICPUDRAFT_28940 [Dictyostelium purpureum]
MISALQWIPKGSANPFPKKFDPNSDEKLDEEELKSIQDNEEVEPTKKDKKNKNKAQPQIDGNDKEIYDRYNFDDYDSDEEDESMMTEDAKNEKTEKVGLKFINRAMKGLMFYKDSDTDPYLQDKEEEDADDIDDIVIRPTDSILITAIATADDEYSHLDIMVYEEDCDNLYVHHDIILSSFPISLAWTDQNPASINEKGSFVAVGTFEPGIEIWDLDVIDNLIPTVTLGGKLDEKKIRGKQKNINKFKPNSHIDSVISLSWNSQQRNVLASGSGDKTVKVWDITTQQCLNTFTHHKDRISALQWNSQEKTALLVGSHDKYVSIVDVRSPDAAYKWSVKGEVECLQWNPHNAKEFIVGTDNGTVVSYDATLGPNAKPVWSVQAHSSGVSSFSYCPGQAGFFATGSSDHTLKLWKLDNNNQVSLIEEKSLQEEVFSVSFFQNSPFILAIGSESQRPNIIDTKKFISVQNAFGFEKQEGSKEPVIFTKQNRNQEGYEEDDGEDEDDESFEDEEDASFGDEEEEEEEEPVKPVKPTKSQQKSKPQQKPKTTQQKKPNKKVGDSDEE